MTSLRRRMLLAVGIAVSLAFLVSGVVVVIVMRASLESRLDDTLVREANAMAELVEQDEGVFEWEGSRVALADSTRALELWREPNERIARSDALSADLAYAARGSRVLASVTLPDGRSARQVTLRFTPRFDDANEPTPAILVLARPTEDLDATVMRIALVLLVAGIAGTLACLLASRWLVGFGLAPLRSLAQRIAEIRETDLGARLANAQTPIEVQPLVARLDELLERLEHAFSRERELTAEVAHELRTPIAGLRSTLELALDRDRPVERYRAALTDCLTITLQTQRIVDVLLSLARLDAGTSRDHATPIAVDALVRTLVDEATPRATERGLVIDANLAPLTATIDRDQLQLVVTNALDNAIAYATDGTIRLTIEGSRLRIANRTTLDPADAPRVFERFWRGDPARAAGIHAGLGLALCKKIVERMNGTITAEVSGGMFTLTIELPA